MDLNRTEEASSSKLRSFPLEMALFYQRHRLKAEAVFALSTREGFGNLEENPTTTNKHTPPKTSNSAACFQMEACSQPSEFSCCSTLLIHLPSYFLNVCTS